MSWLLGGMAWAQLPLVRGNSAARSGMLVYDVHEADDMKARSYVYSLCPRDASCTHLDFTFLEGPAGMDFIRVFDGPDRDAPLLGTLGAKSGSTLMQGNSGCLTVEFTRAEAGLRSTWTALWRGRGEEECLDPARDRKTGMVQDICGPEYRENRHLFQHPREGSYLPASFTYRLLIAREGPLEFEILPDNRLDDYDWELYHFVNEDDSAAIPILNEPAAPHEPQKITLAYNFASGAGSGGATGMTGSERAGRSLFVPKYGPSNPFSRAIDLRKGTELFLTVYPGESECGGFRLLLNETAMHCDQPVGELITVARKLKPEAPSVPARDMFSRSTQIWRIDLSAKANAGLAETLVMPGDWDDLLAGSGHKDKVGALPEARGLTAALVLGLKSGLLEAWSAHDLSTPVHYGDLLDLAERSAAPVEPSPEPFNVFVPGKDWWNPGPGQMSGFHNMLELVVDEVFDKSSGMQSVQIRYVRLIWSDWEGELPDYNVAVFRYNELGPLLAKVRVKDFRNEANSIRLLDLLHSRQFEYITTCKSGKYIMSPASGKFLMERGQELESYHWNE